MDAEYEVLAGDRRSSAGAVVIVMVPVHLVLTLGHRRHALRFSSKSDMCGESITDARNEFDACAWDYFFRLSTLQERQ